MSCPDVLENDDPLKAFSKGLLNFHNQGFFQGGAGGAFAPPPLALACPPLGILF